MLVLLVEPIKVDLSLSDTKFSLLGGIAFASFRTLLGLPKGRMTDRRSRSRILVVGIAMWWLMEALCGVIHKSSARAKLPRQCSRGHPYH